MAKAGLLRVPIFPLAGAVLFPRAQLPLHIFEPRYRAMVRDALASDQRIAMVQPRDSGEPPGLFEVGCIGRIVGSEELDDGRFNIVLEGVSRFRIAGEADVMTPYRQVDADRSGFDDEEDAEPLASIQRAELEREARRYADALGYAVDWEAVGRLDDEMLVNGIAQIAPLDVGSKQALLEAADLAARTDLLVQFMHFQRILPGGADGPETLQ
ncbi:LON peptidase substrate-binding domain-containing protein [Sphingomonas sp. LY54]|uniref:LON peptidase substrate-binding domain-containing protein n=1 Tax=Sphingomonadales TaxID=204457 RepID=UPI002ADEE327|nr:MULTISPECIES: LON peptidase substrate-binding domain-containing protein [Sphingomonadales]MEA1014234.1 LON peptidase substrate-binding domain-containing protein [Sphingosinicella sp. LY1275]WRP27342.1 LON peptidase substrate-binding domain-containing protein [Sphingomonas sp. LY54]